jgi:hypothetical protein
MFAELLARNRGTQHALPENMNEMATMERINVDQIATVTDLLLLRARTTRRRFSTNKIAFVHDRREASRAGRRSILPWRRSTRTPSIPAVRAPNDFRDPERTLFVRARKLGTSTASAAIVATSFAIALVLTCFL